jgi:hypothetical protein
MQRITEPGSYAMPHEVYHSDCCDGPSLSSTGARLLVQKCPAVYRHLQDNPEVKEEFDIGNATHLLVLQPDVYRTKVAELPFQNYRAQEACAARDEARAVGLIPLTIPQQNQVHAMRAALLADDIARHAFRGEVEQSLFARDPDYPGIWLKCRPDIRAGYLVDVKTTTDVEPGAFERAIGNYGYHQQAAWYRMVVEMVLGERPKGFYFLAVQKSPPYLVETMRLDEEAMAWGDILNRRARSIFHWCCAHDRWPSYRARITGPSVAIDVGLPAWHLRELQRRLEAGELEPV